VKNWWVKNNGNQPVRVPIKGCTDVYAFSKKVQQELKTNCQVALFTSLEKEALDPGLEINDLLKADPFRKNTSKSPLFVKLSPVTQDSIVTKRIHVAETDDDGEFTGKYGEYEIINQEGLRDTYKFGLGLVRLAEPSKVINAFYQVKDGEKYHVYKYSQDFAGWQNNEADAMEEETLLAMKTYLMKELGASPIDFPTDLHDSKDNLIQEWDGALLSKETLYLLEAKHSMSVKKIKDLAERIKAFPETLERSVEKDSASKFTNIKGVACGTLFSQECRDEAHRLGLMAVYPSGGRYLVKPDGTGLAFSRT
jgi:hypothetical protein